MNVIYILLSLLIGFLLLGLLFGGSIVFSNRTKIYNSFIMPIFSIIPAAIILRITNINIFKVDNFFDSTSWIILIITDVLVITLVILKSSKGYLSHKEIFINGLEGAMMEIPQRMFMQTFVFVLLNYWNNNAKALSVLVNSIIWCLGIMVQEVIINKKMNRILFIDVLSSFIFSIGIGYVFVRTEFILFPMIGHFIERVFSKIILNDID